MRLPKLAGHLDESAERAMHESLLGGLGGISCGSGACDWRSVIFPLFDIGLGEWRGPGSPLRADLSDQRGSYRFGGCVAKGIPSVVCDVRNLRVVFQNWELQVERQHDVVVSDPFYGDRPLKGFQQHADAPAWAAGGVLGTCERRKCTG